jgi:hypothetical protein
MVLHNSFTGNAASGALDPAVCVGLALLRLSDAVGCRFMQAMVVLC